MLSAVKGSTQRIPADVANLIHYGSPNDRHHRTARRQIRRAGANALVNSVGRNLVSGAMRVAAMFSALYTLRKRR